MHIVDSAYAARCLCGAAVTAPAAYSMLHRTGLQTYYVLAENIDACERCVAIAESRGAREAFVSPEGNSR